MHPVSGSNRAAKRAHRLRITFAIAALCLAVHACDLGSGGAVELSWSLRPASGSGSDKFVSCEGRDAQNNLVRAITRVRLHWQVGSATCSQWWNCDDNHGATRFEVPPSPPPLEANLWLTLECGDPTPGLAPCVDDQPADPTTYIAPAIVRRNVIRGETVTLGAVELVVSDAACPNEPCTCPRTR